MDGVQHATPAAPGPDSNYPFAWSTENLKAPVVHHRYPPPGSIITIRG